MSENIYLGNGVEKFEGDLISFSLNLSKIKEAKEHIFEYKGDKYIKLKVCKKKQTDDYGKTHYVQVDTFKPDPKKQSEHRVEKQDDSEDIPF